MIGSIEMRSLAVGVALVMTLCLFPKEKSYGQLVAGEPAPAFSLKSTKGISHEIAELTQRPLNILFFFDADSKSSRESLAALVGILNEYQTEGLAVWGITQSSKEAVQNLKIQIPVLLDDSDVNHLYHADFLLPAFYVIGPDLKIIDVYQGGGKTTEIQLRSLLRDKLISPEQKEKLFQQHKLSGIQAFRDKQYELAYRELDHALSLRKDRECHLYLSYTLIELKQETKIEAALEDGIRVYADDVRFYQIYVRYLLAHDQTQKALNVLEAALNVKPDDMNLRYLKDFALLSLQESGPSSKDQ